MTKTEETYLEKSYQNYRQIIEKDLPNKFLSLEQWLLVKSNKLLYEIEEPVRFTKRYARGTLIKVDFGVNIGAEFSQKHFAIVISKKDTKLADTLAVIPLTSKEHKNSIPLNSIIIDTALNNIADEMKKLSEEIAEKEMEDTKTDDELLQRFTKLRKVKRYYSYCSELSYAVVDQIKIISKLRIQKPINEYDIVGKLKFDDEIMEKIDKKIISMYTDVKLPKNNE